MKNKFIHTDWTYYIRHKELFYFMKIINQYRIEKKYNKDEIRILEIGSGNGYCASIMIKEGWTIIASDPAPRLPLKTEVLKMSSERINFEDNTFDIIISSNVLEHINNINTSIEEMPSVPR